MGSAPLSSSAMPLKVAALLPLWLALPFILFGLQTASNWLWGGWLAFTWWPLNALYTLLIGLAMPVALWGAVKYVRRGWIRVPVRSLAVLAFLSATVVLVAPVLRRGSWQLVDELLTEKSAYRVYRRPYYLYDTAIELRREVAILPGLIWVSGPRAAPESDGAKLLRLDDGRVQADIHNYHGKQWHYVFPE